MGHIWPYIHLTCQHLLACTCLPRAPTPLGVACGWCLLLSGCTVLFWCTGMSCHASLPLMLGAFRCGPTAVAWPWPQRPVLLWEGRGPSAPGWWVWYDTPRSLQRLLTVAQLSSAPVFTMQYSFVLPRCSI